MAEGARGKTVAHDVHGLTHAHPRQAHVAQPPRVLFSHVGPLTNCVLVEGSTGLLFDSGNSFSHDENLGIGLGFHCVNVQLAGWDLDFTSKDHHIDHIKVQISRVNYREDTGNVSFRVEGVYRDKNADDKFNWEVYYTILALG